MKMKWNVMITAAALLLTVPAAAVNPWGAASVYAQAAASIKIDKSTAAIGDKVQVTGTFLPSAWVTLRVIDTAGAVLVFDAVKSGTGGAYAFTFTVPAKAKGDLKVYTGAGEDVASAVVSVTTGNPGVPGEPGGETGPGTPGTPGPSHTPGPGTPVSTPAPQPTAPVKAAEETSPVSSAGGTIVYTPAITKSADGRVVAMVLAGESALKNALAAGGSSLKINVQPGNADAVVVELTAAAVKLWSALGEAAMLEATTELGSYSLPASVLRSESGSSNGLRLTIAKGTAAQQETIQQAAQKTGATLLASPIDFRAETVRGNTATPINFGYTYASRTLSLPGAVDASRAAGVRYDEASGKLAFVPSVFEVQNGKTTATLKRNGNSLYAVVTASPVFRDLPAAYWATADINLLAAKGIVSGLSDGSFGPAQPVTRAEFTALIVRALGLEDNTRSGFKDVTAGNWYSGPVGAAFAAGLITGYEDGTFRPGQTINRQELAVLIDKALQFAGGRNESLNPSSSLAAFTDQASIAPWAQPAVANITAAGIAHGMDSRRYEPKASAARAEAAAMIKRLLQEIDFIN